MILLTKIAGYVLGIALTLCSLLCLFDFCMAYQNAAASIIHIVVTAAIAVPAILILKSDSFCD